MDAGFKEERPPHPRAKANIFEILTFGYFIINKLYINIFTLSKIQLDS